MKLSYKKLPNLKIVDGASTGQSSIVEAGNKIMSATKIIAAVLVVVSLFIGIMYLNIKREETALMEQTISLEMGKAANLQSGVVLDTTASIISKEGGVPLLVAKKYAMWVYEAGIKYSIDPMLILSIMSIESGFNYKAISSTGPIGILQIAFTHHKDKVTSAADLFDPKTNIYVGTQIMREYSNRSSSETEMLLRYNGSLGQAPVYAVKVLSKKRTYENKIMEAVVQSI